VEENHSKGAGGPDYIAGLLTDLKRPGMLTTRSYGAASSAVAPFNEKGPVVTTILGLLFDGGKRRKARQVIGSTDEIGLHAQEPRTVNDIYASSSALGLDHLRSPMHNGRAERPTVVAANPPAPFA
jgi:hypothetical protein